MKAWYSFVIVSTIVIVLWQVISLIFLFWVDEEKGEKIWIASLPLVVLCIAIQGIWKLIILSSKI